MQPAASLRSFDKKTPARPAAAKLQKIVAMADGGESIFYIQGQAERDLMRQRRNKRAATQDSAKESEARFAPAQCGCL